MLAHSIDIGAAKGAAYRATCVPVLLEIIERHDEHTVSDAEDAARRLFDIGERTSDVKRSMARCLSRAEEKLTSLTAAFAPIQDKAVPERVVLQGRIQSYASLISSLKGYLADFQEAPAQFAAVRATAGGASPASKSGGLGLALPLVAIVLVVGGGLAFWLTKKSAPDVTLSAAQTAVATASAPPVAPTTNTAAATTAAEASAEPVSKRAHPSKPPHPLEEEALTQSGDQSDTSQLALASQAR